MKPCLYLLTLLLSNLSLLRTGGWILLGSLPFCLSVSNAQVILTEVMYDADTLEYHNEFVEIFNSGTDPVDLSGWRIGDGIEIDQIIETGDGYYLNPGQFGIVLDGSYFENSTTYDLLIPPEALVLTIEDASFGKSGWSNSIAEPVILVNSDGDTVQLYCYSLDNSPGYSDEKIGLTENNQSENWANAFVLKGTPGFRNSVSLYNFDLSIDSVKIEPRFPLVNVPVTFTAIIKNRGLNAAGEAHLILFEDFNKDRKIDEHEIIERQEFNTPLPPEISRRVDFELSGFEAGEHDIGISVDYRADENTSNNLKMVEIGVEEAEYGLIINEIMYQPETNESEWLEIYNNAPKDINLRNWLFADARDTVCLTKEPLEIASHSYLVLCGDSTVSEHYGFSNKDMLPVRAFPTLNNDGDDLSLLTPSGRIEERVSYSGSWMGRDVSSGVSLERIRAETSSQLAENWAACVDITGSTPARQNSIRVDIPIEKSRISIHPNPFSPDGDGYEDFAVFQFNLPYDTAFLTVDVFDILGRPVAKLARSRPIGSSGTVIWDGKTDDGRIARIGIYIILFRINRSNGDIYKEIKATIVVAKK